MAFTSLTTFESFFNKNTIYISPPSIATIDVRNCIFNFTTISNANNYIITAIPQSSIYFGNSTSNGTTSPITVYNLYPNTRYIAYITATYPSRNPISSSGISFTTSSYTSTILQSIGTNYITIDNYLSNYNIYCTSSNQTIYKATTAGTTYGSLSTYIGYGGGNSGNNILATDNSVKLGFPQEIAIFNNNIYFVDRVYGLIRMVPAISGTYYNISMTANYIYNIAGNSTSTYNDNSAATSTGLNLPYGLAINSTNQDIYISDTVNNSIRKLNFTTGIITTIAGNGTANYTGDNGNASSATFNEPRGLILDPSNNLYIADRLNHAVRKITATNNVISSSSVISTYFALGIDCYPVSIKMDKYNNFYISDSNTSTIKIAQYSTGTGLTATTIITNATGVSDMVIDNSGTIFACTQSSVNIYKK